MLLTGITIEKGECCNETQLSIGRDPGCHIFGHRARGPFHSVHELVPRGHVGTLSRTGCEILLKYIHPLMADFGILGGVLFAVSAYGYFSKQNWAFLLSVIGIVLALLGSWFINVPYMAADLPPVYFLLSGRTCLSTFCSCGRWPAFPGAARLSPC